MFGCHRNPHVFNYTTPFRKSSGFWKHKRCLRWVVKIFFHTIWHLVEFVWVISADHLRERKLLRQRVSTIRGWFKRKIFLRAVSKGPSPVVDRFHLGILVADPARASYYDPFSPDRLQWLIFWSAQNSVGTFQFRESRSVPKSRVSLTDMCLGSLTIDWFFQLNFLNIFFCLFRNSR